MIYSIISIICILIGFWLGKGCPYPKSSKTENINITPTTVENNEENKRKQEDLEKQFEEMLNYSGSVGKGVKW